MKFQPEYQLLKNIGPFKSGQIITGITIDMTSEVSWAVDLSKSPDWFKPLRGTWIPQKGDKFYYLDENLVVQSDTLKQTVEELDPKSPAALKLAAGNFYSEEVQARNVANKVRETHEQFNVGLSQDSLKEKKPGVSGALR